MISITQFSISNDLAEMQLDIQVSAGKRVINLKAWDQGTFKDPVTAIDLSGKLSGASEIESITLIPSDFNAGSFDGLYLIEIESDDLADKKAMVAAINLKQYYGIIAALLYSVNTSCLNCNYNMQNAILLDMYIEAIKTSLQVGRFRDAITFINKITIITTSSECIACDQTTVNSSGDGWTSVGVLDCNLVLIGANV